jgi:hypothetical protein
VLKRPELAALIGNVAANWVLVEEGMVTLYMLVMGKTLPNNPGWAPPTHPVARQIFDVVESISARVKLLDELCRWYASVEEAAEFSAMAPEIRKVAGARAEIVHAAWAIADELPNSLVLRPMFGKTMVWDRRDFENVSERILAIHRRLEALTHSFYQRQDRMQEPER